MVKVQENQFDGQGPRTVNISRIQEFCSPVEVTMNPGASNEVVIPIVNPAAHLTCYKDRQPKPLIKAQVISTFDQLDPIALDVRKQRKTELCVPSQLLPQQGATPTATPTPAAPSLDHFDLYRARRTRGTTKFVRETVHLKDQFLDEDVELRKLAQFGVPTDKDGVGITNSLTHLTCYALRAPRFRIQEVGVDNPFGSNQRLRVRRPSALCVPSLKQVVSLSN